MCRDGGEGYLAGDGNFVEDVPKHDPDHLVAAVEIEDNALPVAADDVAQIEVAGKHDSNTCGWEQMAAITSKPGHRDIGKAPK